MHFKPIGIFDSGVGGLAVVRAIKEILPCESLYYVGDTINVPYGDKSRHQIQTYVRKIGNILLQQDCKAIVIACSTATAAAAEVLQQHVGVHIPVVNVIDPVIAYLTKYYAGKTLGLIGTQYTIDTAIYTKKLQATQANIQLKSVATPLLAPMIEADECDPYILGSYLANPLLSSMQGLILGCTHYWLIKEQIEHYYRNQLEIISGPYLLAIHLRELLMHKKMANLAPPFDRDHFMITSPSPSFEAIAKNLFSENIYPIHLLEA